MRFWPRFTSKPAEPPKPKPRKLAQPMTVADEVRESAVLELRAGGKRLRAVVIGQGPKQGRHLVFLHEGLGCIALWRSFPASIARATGCNALVYERQGHGGADPIEPPRPLDYLEREAETVLPEVLDHFGIERAILIGHSDGGTIALLFAARYPERAEGVVAIAAHAYVEDAALEGIRRTKAAYEKDNRLHERLARYHGENTDGLFHAWADTWLSDGFRTWNIEARLADAKAPALLIQGTADEYASPEQLHRIAAALGGPAESLLLKGSGHEPQRDAEPAVTEAIARFVKQVQAGAPGEVALDPPP
ncbi:MAG: alpha/beta fold hydrolase [Alphaproteobacteria bacterium]